jgi:hypothetical protein
LLHIRWLRQNRTYPWQYETQMFCSS